MTSIHTEQLDLFSLPPYNTAEEKIYYEKLPPTYFNKNSASAVTFHMDPQPTDYVDLSKTELHVKLYVEKDDGTEFVNTNDVRESVTPIDVILHTMWSSVEVYANQKLISSAGTEYPYKSIIEANLNYNKNCKQYQMYTIGFSNEDGSNPTTTLPMDFPTNNGLKTRSEWFGLSKRDKHVEFIGPINADICTQNRLILNGVGLNFKFWPSQDAFRLICSENVGKGKLMIEDIFLRICKVAVSPEVRLGHAAALELAPARYPFNKIDVRPLAIDKGNSVANFSNIFEGLVPTKMIVGMVSQDNYLGNFQTNPFYFEHFNIRSIGLEIGNERIPAEPYEFDFEKNPYLDGLMSLYRCSDKVWENTDLGITRELYQNGLTLIGFNVDPTAPSNVDYLGVPRRGNLNMSIKFKKATPCNVTVIVYAVFPGRVDIDNTRLVIPYDVKQLIDEIQTNNVKAAIAPAA